MKFEIERFRHSIDGHISPVIEKSLSKEKFLKLAVMAVSKVPKLRELAVSNQAGLFTELIACAQMGLLPDGKDAVILPFKNTAKLIPMVWGMVRLARESGEIKSIWADIVHENDQFESWADSSGQHFIHRPNYDGERGPIKMAYAASVLENGQTELEVMSMADISAVEKTSRSNNVWQGAFRSEMVKKTPLRRLLKRLPMTPKLEKVVEHGDKDYDFETTARTPQETSERLTQALEGSDGS